MTKTSDSANRLQGKPQAAAPSAGEAHKVDIGALRGAGIHAQLAYIQQSVVAPKDLENEERGFSYRSIEGILAAVKPFLMELGCTLTFSEDIRTVGEAAYIVSTATLTNAAGGQVSSTAFAREDKNLPGMCSAQITGACTSYARKYAAAGLLALDNNRVAGVTEIDSIPALDNGGDWSGGASDDVYPTRGPKIPIANATALPILHPGDPAAAWKEEVKRCTEWTGTRKDYEEDLAGRWITDQETKTLLFFRRGRPFAGE